MIYYSDVHGLFDPDDTNNHAKRKWDSYYEFTKRHNVDIVMVGNSHLYTGINPKNLSTALGVNAFILATPGTLIHDSYFALKEALARAKPKLVIVETYGIRKVKPYDLKGSGLSDQFKSFYARKHLFIKMASTPFLFKVGHYPYAWSNTLRNHDFLFSDTTQLRINWQRYKNRSKRRKNKKLYLGRFVIFLTGLEESVLRKYDSFGPPVDFGKWEYNKTTINYIDKIVQLCEKNGVKLMFLTLPMYYRHITNYEIWKEKMTKYILRSYANRWLDMQMPYDTSMFTTECFENTYKGNQHLTYRGSLIATYKLANYIKHELQVDLPYRGNDPEWRNMFYGEEGYFENFPVMPHDNVNQLLATQVKGTNVTVSEVSLIRRKQGQKNVLIAKVYDNEHDLSRCMLHLKVRYADREGEKTTVIALQHDIYHWMKGRFIYKLMIPPVKILAVENAEITCPSTPL